jgi:hypothetical protein
MPVNVYDMEWEVILRSGRIRQYFTEMRQEIRRLTDENARLRQQSSSPQPRQVTPVSQRPPLTPFREATERFSGQPLIEEERSEKKPEEDLDSSAERFKLLELE